LPQSFELPNLAQEACTMQQISFERGSIYTEEGRFGGLQTPANQLAQVIQKRLTLHKPYFHHNHAPDLKRQHST
jgi:hypothetical protein